MNLRILPLVVSALLILTPIGRGQVLISEFMAANDHGLLDEDNFPSDWIELYNTATASFNLNGWFLTDDAQKLTKWRFPAVSISGHGFLVVFASNKDRRVVGAPLHTNFKLNADGEYLALVRPDGTNRVSEFAPAFPKQYSDVSYGIGRLTTLVTNGAPARVIVPTNGTLGSAWINNAFDDSQWLSGANGVGYETLVPGFAVRVVKANVTVGSIDAADEVLATPSEQVAIYGENAPVLNYLNSGGSGVYEGDAPVPGLVGDVDDYVLEATATLTIPSAGDWTFGVSSDDGFRLVIGDFEMSYPWPRGPDNTLSTFHFDASGSYPLRLVFFEQGGGSEVELWAAPGNYPGWTPDFSLVGDTASGGLAVVSTPVAGGGGTSYRPDIHTDVQAAMFNQQVSAYVRVPFLATNVSAFESLTLKVKYDDGFVAYLNGVPVAKRGAPAAPAWNKPATATHSATAYELIDISSAIGSLQEGSNLLALHGMNNSASGSAFLILAELVEFRVGGAAYNYLSPATPGGANVAGYPALADPVQFSIRGGIYTNDLTVALFSPSPGSSIRYTLDNTTPTETSALYVGPIPVASSVAIRARAFAPGLLPSTPTTEAYTVLESDLINFSSPLPIVIINAYGRQIVQDMPARVPANLTVIDTRKTTGVATFFGRPEFHGRAGIEGRGQTSWMFPKKPYNVETRDENDQDLSVGLLGMPAGSDWVLLNVYNDKTFMNDFLGHELFEKMGHYAVRRRYVEVFLNGIRPEGDADPSGKLSYDDYVGIYLLLEKIKIGPDRVDIARLAPTDNAEPGISGGYIFKKDKDSPGDWNFYTWSGQGLKYHDPKGEELTAVQRNWFENYINQFEIALYGDDWLSPSAGYAKYIDVDSFVDYHWIVEFTKQIDGYRLSDFLHKDRDGKITFGPIWDWNLSFGNADYMDGQYPENWYWPVISSSEHLWLRRLIAEPGDPDFNQKIVDRWSVLRTNVLNITNLLARSDEIATLIDQAQARDFERFPRLGDYVWPNPPGLASATTYQEVRDWVKDWLRQRYAWIDSQYLAIPTLSSPGGPIAAGTPLTLKAPLGTVYYTMDGTDPRQAGGGLSPKAVPYTKTISLNSNAKVVARAKSGTTWSGPAAASFWTHIPPLIVTELMYHPSPPPAGSTNAVDDFQFIELMNAGPDVLDLTGAKFTRGIEYTFANGSLGPQTRLVLVRNLDAFQSRYGTAINVAGTFSKSLDHGGERITLIGPLGEPILDFSYNDAWEPITDGYGFSLVIANEQAPLSSWNDPSSWRPSAKLGGSPGTGDGVVTLGTVLINEILSASTPPRRDAIELYNPTGNAVDISHWYLTDDHSVPAKYAIPEGTVLAPGAYIVLDESQFKADPSAATSFALSSRGEEVYLFSADASGTLTGYMDGLSFGGAWPDVTFGRYTNSVGDIQYPAQWRNTLGGPNSGPEVGPVVISELGFDPPDRDAEFVELKNLTDQPIKLFDPLIPTNRWRIKGVGFDFPANVEIAPCGLLLVVGGDPAAFRSLHNIPLEVPVYGPYSGALENHGQAIELQRPNPPDSESDPVPVGYSAVDVVHYDAQSPWPTNRFMAGTSLERLAANAYGNDPGNWRASSWPGSPGKETPGSDHLLPPRIDSIEVVSGVQASITIRFEIGAGQGCVIQYRDTLEQGQWQIARVLDPSPTSCPAVFNDPVPAGRPARFYRLSAP